MVDTNIRLKRVGPNEVHVSVIRGEFPEAYGLAAAIVLEPGSQLTTRMVDAEVKYLEARLKRFEEEAGA